MSYLPWGTRQRPGAGFWAWAKWLDKGRSGPRPNVTWRVPLWAWKRYEIHKGPPKPPPVQAGSVFAGQGMFCAWDPRAALRLSGLLDWVAVQAEGQTDGQPWATPEIVTDLKQAFRYVHVWEAEVREGGAAVTRLGANGGYIGQAESQVQHDACLALPWSALDGPPKAIVSNITYLPDSPTAWPNNWACIPEAYANANPQATVANLHYEAYKRGASDIYPCFGVYDASAEQPGVGRRVALEAYYTDWQRLGLKGWNGYLCETLTGADVAFLGGLRRTG